MDFDLKVGRIVHFHDDLYPPTMDCLAAIVTVVRNPTMCDLQVFGARNDRDVYAQVVQGWGHLSWHDPRTCQG